MKLMSVLLVLACTLVQTGVAQTATHIHASRSIKNSVVSDRAVEITNGLQIRDEKLRLVVQSLLYTHLETLQGIFNKRKEALEIAERFPSDNSELTTARTKAAWDAANRQLNSAYVNFLGKISSHLTLGQIEQLKDLLTENGLQNELDKFFVLLPQLTEVHKAHIIAYLKEARENAMNAETVQERCEWFIKYRGRANNYLAAAGYDLRKATNELEARGRIRKL